MTLTEIFLRHAAEEYSQMRLGLDRVRDTLGSLSNPQDQYPSILIAGTNGKGSVARMLESVLLSAGHRVGLYTSPHLERFTERIRIGGVEVTEGEVEAILEGFRGKGIWQGDGTMRSPKGEVLTWFEKITVLAFEAFRRAKISLAILEVGLGGRLDATNVVQPLASAITSIGLDHTEILGNSVFEIAREKAGVMRSEFPVVLGPLKQELREFLVQAAHLAGAKPLTAMKAVGSSDNFSYGEFANLRLSLLGRHQLDNAAVAIEMLKILKDRGFAWDELHLREGLVRAKNPGRLEFFPGSPPILFDGAHNPPAVQALADFLKGELKGRALNIVMGMMRDKDQKSVLKIFQDLNPRWFFCELPHPRSLGMDDWKKLSDRMMLKAQFFHDPATALEAAKAETGEGGLVLVTGSLHLVGSLRSTLS